MCSQPRKSREHPPHLTKQEPEAPLYYISGETTIIKTGKEFIRGILNKDLKFPIRGGSWYVLKDGKKIKCPTTPSYITKALKLTQQVKSAEDVEIKPEWRPGKGWTYALEIIVK